MSLARYEMIQYQDGTVAAKTQSQWDRCFGKCNRRTFHKSGEIYTQGRLKSWGRKHSVQINPDDLAQLPKKVWWQD